MAERVSKRLMEIVDALPLKEGRFPIMLRGKKCNSKGKASMDGPVNLPHLYIIKLFITI
jgi:hypothetical protein